MHGDFIVNAKIKKKKKTENVHIKDKPNQTII